MRDIFIIVMLLSVVTLDAAAQYVLTNPTASQTVTQPNGTSLQVLGGNGLQGNPTNGIFHAEMFSGVDVATKLNACLTAAQATAASAICDARGLAGNQTLGSNMFAGIVSPVVLLVNGDTAFTVNATQRVLSPYTKIEGTKTFGPNYTFVAGATLGANAMFDIKDAPDFQMSHISISGNSTASSCILMHGGLINIFDARFEDVFVYGCQADFDNSLESQYSVGFLKSGSTVTGTLTSGSFPSTWVGNNAPGIVVTSASFSDYVSSIITIHVTSTTSFTASVPQGSWNPSESSATGTIVSVSGMQDWTCYHCFAAGASQAAVRIAYPMLKWFGGRIYNNTGNGLQLDGNGVAYVSGTVFSANSFDVFANTNTNQFYGNGDWFENSTNGILGTVSGSVGNQFNISNSELHTNSSSNMFNLSGSGSQTALTLDGDYLAPSSSSVIANLSSAVALSCIGGCPSYSGIGALAGSVFGSNGVTSGVNYGGGAATVPSNMHSMLASGIGNNFSNGNGETDIWNAFINTSGTDPIFRILQNSSTGYSTVFSVLRDGQLNLNLTPIQSNTTSNYAVPIFINGVQYWLRLSSAQ